MCSGGWTFVIPVLVLAGAAHLLLNSFVTIFLVLSAFMLAYLFRDPVRKIPPIPLAVVSPVDARVVAIEKTQDPYLNRPCQRIDLEMGPFSVYTVRSPIEGTIKQQWQASSEHIMSRALWVQTDEQDDVVFEIRRETMLRRLRCAVQIGERVGQGQRCGTIRFGAPLSVYVPESARLLVSCGERVKGGADCLAEFVHN